MLCTSDNCHVKSAEPSVCLQGDGVSRGEAPSRVEGGEQDAEETGQASQVQVWTRLGYFFSCTTSDKLLNVSPQSPCL